MRVKEFFLISLYFCTRNQLGNCCRIDPTILTLSSPSAPNAVHARPVSPVGPVVLQILDIGNHAWGHAPLNFDFFLGSSIKLAGQTLLQAFE